MVNIAEVISLIFLVLAFANLTHAAIKNSKWKYFAFAFFFPLITGITTVAEDYIFPTFMNYLEHISWMLGAIFFALALFKYSKNIWGGK
ncbi:hypothetical protein HOA92_02620 [archaeon]|jgi:hypothetical protein|nr:hypothetical protein [archaeon]MBT6761908.1 hypothetical protein [archaeon]